MLFALGAYGLWGLFPLFFRLLEPAGALEVLAHRIVWTLAVVGCLLLVLRGLPRLKAIAGDRRLLRLLSAAAVLIAVNWGIYIYAVTSDQVVEAALGYFVTPIFTVLLGVVVLSERLRPAQWVALGIAAVAVLVLSVENGSPPWIALTLALSFGTYGLCKKKANVGAVESLAVETLVLAPVALVFLVVLGTTGLATFGNEGSGHALLLVVSGLVTTVPLLLFGAAATRVPLSTLGPLQYLTPTVQFLLGVLAFNEPLPPARLAGFVLVWTGLAIFTADAVRHHRRLPRPGASRPDHATPESAGIVAPSL